MRRCVTLVLALLVAALSAVGNASLPSASAEPDTLRAGFAARTITPIGEPPEGWDFWQNPRSGVWSEPFEDANANGCYDPGERHTDDVRNSVIDPQSTGKWDGVWTNAGFGGRCAKGKFDDTWARAVVVSSGGKTVAMVSLDVVGFFNEEIEQARKELLATRRVPALDGFIVASTHTHEGPDTMGLWGQLPHDGKFPLYQAFIRARIVEAVVAAYESMAPAAVRFGHGQATHGTHPVTGATLPIIQDSRPPQVIDPDVWTAQFVDPEGDTIGTIVNWSNHPEALWSGNPMISSDYPHATREMMERELGGISVFFSGSVGGLMTTRSAPQGLTPYEWLELVGEEVAETAIASLEGQPLLSDPTLDVAHQVFFLQMDNQSLRALNTAGLFDKQTYTAGVPSGTSGETTRTEMYAVKLGPAVFVTVPGELFPEIALGVYGRPDCPAADTGRPHEPGIRQQFPDSSYHFVLGLGMDELGYIVPGYDFWSVGVDRPSGRGNNDPSNPQRWASRELGSSSALTYIGVEQATDPCGVRHYEETVSASSVMAPVVACTAAQLAGRDPWSDLAAYPACSPENTKTGPMGTRPTNLLD
ncbi:MAG TPA: hypothetical protein VM840_12125 [Actinomycetota bacterium]|nr:hypothetical protein [Actinomycetota bacterium]